MFKSKGSLVKEMLPLHSLLESMVRKGGREGERKTGRERQREGRREGENVYTPICVRCVCVHGGQLG